MSKLETPLTERFWDGQGTLVLEYLAVRGTKTQGKRLIDGVILPDGPSVKAHWREVNIVDKDIVCVQTKAKRLCMYLLGQAVFSKQILLKECGARSVRTVALCVQDDDVLRPLAEEMGVEVVVMST